MSISATQEVQERRAWLQQAMPIKEREFLGFFINKFDIYTYNMQYTYTTRFFKKYNTYPCTLPVG